MYQFVRGRFPLIYVDGEVAWMQNKLILTGQEMAIAVDAGGSGSNYCPNADR